MLTVSSIIYYLVSQLHVHEIASDCSWDQQKINGTYGYCKLGDA